MKLAPVAARSPGISGRSAWQVRAGADDGCVTAPQTGVPLPTLVSLRSTRFYKRRKQRDTGIIELLVVL
jgi:hypothetical protein